MAEGPTTMNGPLHTEDASLSDRKITAYFATLDQAQAVRDKLVIAEIPDGQITVTDAAAEAGHVKAADQSMIGKVREAILPDDGQRATKDAAASGDVRLVVTPMAEDVDRVVDIIRAGKPHHFDADLERWRNSPPA